MGWTTCFTAKHFKLSNNTYLVDRKKECDDLLTWEVKSAKGDTISRRVIKSVMVGSVYYAAVKKNETKVFAAVIKTCGKGRDGTIWGYKAMDETMGPCEDKCPASILALLTYTNDPMAIEWRTRCKENLVRSKNRKNGILPINAPKGVIIQDEKGKWLISNSKVIALGYSGVKFTKARWKTVENAILHFLGEYGTDEQKAEYAKSGQRCPSEWQ